MNPQPSKLPILIGLLLIIAGPALLLTHFLGGKRSSNNSLFDLRSPIISKETRANLEVKNGEVSRDSLYIFHVEVPGSGGETNKEITDLEEQMTGVNRDVDSSSDSKTFSSAGNDSGLADATKRKLDAELEEEYGSGDGSIADILVSKDEYKKYKNGDSVSFVYDINDLSHAKLKETLVTASDTRSKKDDASTWFLAAGCLTVLGIILIIRSKRRAAQEQQVDVLSSLPTVSSAVKKNTSSTEIGRPDKF